MPIAYAADTTGLAFLTGDVLIDFRTMANGAAGSALTGQPFFNDTSATANTIVAPTVLAGALVASGLSIDGTTTATYPGLKLREDIKSAYADIAFGHASDSFGLIATSGVGLTSVVDSSIHIVFNSVGWTISYYVGGSPTNVQSGAVATSLNTKVRVGWRISGNDIYILQPNGVEAGPYTSSATATRSNHCLIFEHFRADGVPPSLKIYTVAANLFATPAAAGRTNLFTHINDIADASWIKGQMTLPVVSGQTDAAGGTLAEKVLEDTSGATHDLYQGSIAKGASAAKRFTMRARIKGVSQDWVALTCYNGGFSALAQCYFNMTTAALGTGAGTFTKQTYMADSLGNGWSQVQLDFITDADAAIFPIFSTANADGGASHAGSTSKGMLIYDEWIFERPV